MWTVVAVAAGVKLFPTTIKNRTDLLHYAEL